MPGYRAPEATIGPASRVPLAFAGLVQGRAGRRGARGGAGSAARSAARSPGRRPRCPRRSPGTGPLRAPADGAAAVPPDALVRAVIAWTQLFGMISFELFGQFVGSFEPADALFAQAVVQFAAFVGLG